MRKLFLIMLSLLFVNTLAVAKELKTLPLPKQLQELQKADHKIVYLGKKAGYNGWLVSANGKAYVAYAAEKAEGVVVGVLYDKDGYELTEDQLLQMLKKEKVASCNELDKVVNFQTPKDDSVAPTKGPSRCGDVKDNNEKIAAPKAEQVVTEKVANPNLELWKKIANLATINIGDKGGTIYVVADAMCHYCKDYLKTLTPYIDAGKLQVKVIPIGILGYDSTEMSASVLASKDPAKVWMDIVSGKSYTTPETVDNNKISSVTNNTDVLGEFDIHSTPQTIYKNAKGDIVIKRGSQDNIDELIIDLAK